VEGQASHSKGLVRGLKLYARPSYLETGLALDQKTSNMSNNVISRDAPFRYIWGHIKKTGLPKSGERLFELKGKDQFVCRSHPADDPNIGWDGVNPCVNLMTNVIDHPTGGIKLNNYFTSVDLYPGIPDWVKADRIKNGAVLEIHQTAGAIECKELFMPPFIVRYVVDMVYASHLLKSVWLINQYGTDPVTIEADGFECEAEHGIFFALHQGGQGYKDRWMNISNLKPFRPTGMTELAIAVYPDKITWYLKGINIKEHGVLADFLYTLLITSLPQMNFTVNSSFYVKELTVSRL